MRAGAEEHVHVGEEDFPLDNRMVHVQDEIQRGADVVWGYYTQRSRYATRALVTCPREGQPRPYRR